MEDSAKAAEAGTWTTGTAEAGTGKAGTDSYTWSTRVILPVPVYSIHLMVIVFQYYKIKFE